MKPKKNLITSQFGFTVIELMVVFLILITLTSIVIVQWNSLTPNRTLNIAVNELVTQIRKVQSYASSSRNYANTPVKYYLMKFTKGESYYSIDAVDAAAGNTYHRSIESYNMPSSFYIDNIDFEDQDGKAAEENLACAWVVFSTVQSQAYFFQGDKVECDEISQLPSDDYATLFNPPVLANRASFNMKLRVKHVTKELFKEITVHGLSGGVESN